MTLRHPQRVRAGSPPDAVPSCASPRGMRPVGGGRPPCDSYRMRPSSTAVSAVFYVAGTVTVAAVLADVLSAVLPDGLAVRIAHNSEGLVLALLLAAWIQFARPRLAGASREWRITALVAVGCVVVGAGLLLTDLPSRFRTLNEAFLAAAVVIPYLQVRRPLPAGLAPALAAAVLVVVGSTHRTELTTALAEAAGVLLLVPLAFDVVDRGILDPEGRTSPRTRLAWYVFLVAAPAAFAVLQYGVGVTGGAGEVIRYAVRITEAFVCLLLVELFFAVGLGRTGRRAAGVRRAFPVRA